MAQPIPRGDSPAATRPEISRGVTPREGSRVVLAAGHEELAGGDTQVRPAALVTNDEIPSLVRQEEFASPKRVAFGRPGSRSDTRVVVGPATQLSRSGGVLTAVPNVRQQPSEALLGGSPIHIESIGRSPDSLAGVRLGGLYVGDGGDLPPPLVEEIGPGLLQGQPAEGIIVEGEAPIFGAVLSEVSTPCCDECSRLGKFLRMFHRDEPCPDGGIGRERLAFAPMYVDIATPLPNSLRIRFDAAYNVQAPDRAEFIYSSMQGFDRIDYQDIRFQLELGGPKLSTATEIPIRVLDPVLGENTTGQGDMSVTVKTVWLDGENWTITQLFRTILNTGSVTHGTGTGHVRMEPGALFMLRWSEQTYWHGELKYRFPIGGDPLHSGQVMQVGSALSNIIYETDQIAILRSLEVISHFVLDGRQFVAPMTTVPVDGMMITNIAPSLRFVMENSGGDLGLIEFGVSSSTALTSDRWHSTMLSFEMRFSY